MTEYISEEKITQRLTKTRSTNDEIDHSLPNDNGDDNNCPSNSEPETESDLKKAYLHQYTKNELFIKSVQIMFPLWKIIVFEQTYFYLLSIFYYYHPVMNGHLIDSITKQDSKLLNYYFQWLLFLYVYFFGIEQLHAFMKYHCKLQNELFFKKILLKSIGEKDIDFFDLFQTGELTKRVYDADNLYHDNHVFILLTIMRDAIKCILLLKKLWSFNIEIILMNIALIAVSFILKSISNGYLEQFTKKMEDDYDDNANYLNQFISNIRTIKTFNSEQIEVDRIISIEENMYQPQSMESYRIWEHINWFISNCGETVVMLFSGYQAINGKMTYGDLLVFQSFQSNLKQSLLQIYQNYSSCLRNFHKWQKYFEIIDYKSTIVSDKNLMPKSFNGEIAFNEVSFAYPHKSKCTILHSLSFKIKPGKVVAIAGQSGTGKSTIASLIERLYDPTEGSITIDGIDIKDLSLGWLRRKIGYVSQEPVLNSGTIEENITYGCKKYTQDDLDDVCRLANVDLFINDTALFPLGLRSLVGERGVKVSGGQKQRIAIARALMKQCSILILDEATSALDSESENEVQTAIDNIIKQKHITTLIIAHRLSTIKNADVILYLEKGLIVEQGTHDQLIALNGKYKQLVYTQLVK